MLTGWQSWSVTSFKYRFGLKRDFNPLLTEYIPPNLESGSFKLKKPIKGWCSWYAFGRNISQKTIIDQVIWFRNNREKNNIDYILIDEGWTKWGEWNKTKKEIFGKGMKALSNEIHGLGFKSGIWMAPFLVEEDSEVFKNHKDWLVHKNGILLNGINWTPFDDFYFKRYLLDIRKPEVKKYIFESIDFLIENCKYDLLKLDFLYSVYFIPDINPNEAGGFIRNIFKYIKDKYPEVYTIACGTPLVPVIGVADSVRIGPDTISPILDGVPVISSLYHNLRIKSVLKNIEMRKFTSKYWNIDSDVFVCRDSIGVNSKLIDELYKSIKSCGGNIFLGDDMTKLSIPKIKKYIEPLLND